METRQPITPRVVQIFTQKAFRKKQETAGLSLTDAREAVAKEFGFDSWQHVKDLEKKYSILLVTKDRCNLWLESKVTIDHDQGCKSFSVTLTGFEDADDDLEKPITIGKLRGHMWKMGKQSLFETFDPISQELADFAAFFEDEFDKSDEECVTSLAYIEELYIEERFDELHFGKALLKSFFNNLGDLVGAVFTYPMPSTRIKGPHYDSIEWDRSRERVALHKRIYTELGFDRIGATDYYYVNNEYVNEKLDAFPSIVSEEQM